MAPRLPQEVLNDILREANIDPLGGNGSELFSFSNQSLPEIGRSSLPPQPSQAGVVSNRFNPPELDVRPSLTNAQQISLGPQDDQKLQDAIRVMGDPRSSVGPMDAREMGQLEAERLALMEPAPRKGGWQTLGESLLGQFSTGNPFAIQNMREAKRQKALDIKTKRYEELKAEEEARLERVRQDAIDEQERRLSEALIGQYKATTRMRDLEADVAELELASPAEREIFTSEFQLWQSQNPGGALEEWWKAKPQDPTRPRTEVVGGRYLIDIDTFPPKLLFDLRELGLDQQLPSTLTDKTPRDTPKGLYDEVSMWTVGPLGAGAAAIGEVFGTSPEITEIRQRFDAGRGALRRAFMESPRYLLGEAEMIEEELSDALAPKYYRNPNTTKARMRSVDAFLDGRVEHLENVRQSPDTPFDRRDVYKEVITQIRYFQDILGVPDVLSDEDLESRYEGISEEDLEAYRVSGSNLEISEWLASRP